MDTPVKNRDQTVILGWNWSAGQSSYYGGFFAMGIGVLLIVSGIWLGWFALPIGAMLAFYHAPMRNPKTPVIMIAPDGIGIKDVGIITWTSIKSAEIKTFAVRTMENKALTITLHDDVPAPAHSLQHHLHIRPVSLEGQTIKIWFRLLDIDDQKMAALGALFGEKADQLNMG